MKIEISPLDELRKEKALLKAQVEASEDVMAQQWSYLGDNAVSLLFSSVFHGIAGKLGFVQKDRRIRSGSSGGGVIQNLISGISANRSLLWEILQPMLWAFAVKRIKSIFSRKKK